MEETTPDALPTDTEHPKEVLMEWTAPTRPVHDRSPRWYAIGAGLLLLCIAYGILSGNWTLSLLAGLIGGTYYLIRHEPPVLRTITIGKNGFRYGSDFFHWDECKDFWLVRTPGYGELRIRRMRGPNKEIIIQTADIDHTEIRTILSQFLPFHAERNERLMDIVIRICKL